MPWKRSLIATYPTVGSILDKVPLLSVDPAAESVSCFGSCTSPVSDEHTWVGPCKVGQNPTSATVGAKTRPLSGVTHLLAGSSL